MVSKQQLMKLAWIISIVTARIWRMEEGNVFTGVCQSTEAEVREKRVPWSGQGIPPSLIPSLPPSLSPAPLPPWSGQRYHPLARIGLPPLAMTGVLPLPPFSPSLPPATSRPPPPPHKDRGTPHSPPPGDKASTTVQHRRYASCVHAGGLSCSTIRNTGTGAPLGQL